MAVGVKELLGFDPPDVLTAPFTHGPDESERPCVNRTWEAGAAGFGGGREEGRERGKNIEKNENSACL